MPNKVEIQVEVTGAAAAQQKLAALEAAGFAPGGAAEASTSAASGSASSAAGGMARQALESREVAISSRAAADSLGFAKRQFTAAREEAAALKIGFGSSAAGMERASASTESLTRGVWKLDGAASAAGRSALEGASGADKVAGMLRFIPGAGERAAFGVRTAFSALGITSGAAAAGVLTVAAAIAALGVGVWKWYQAVKDRKAAEQVDRELADPNSERSLALVEETRKKSEESSWNNINGRAADPTAEGELKALWKSRRDSWKAMSTAEFKAAREELTEKYAAADDQKSTLKDLGKRAATAYATGDEGEWQRLRKLEQDVKSGALQKGMGVSRASDAVAIEDARAGKVQSARDEAEARWRAADERIASEKKKLAWEVKNAAAVGDSVGGAKSAAALAALNNGTAKSLGGGDAEQGLARFGELQAAASDRAKRLVEEDGQYRVAPALQQGSREAAQMVANIQSGQSTEPPQVKEQKLTNTLLQRFLDKLMPNGVNATPVETYGG